MWDEINICEANLENIISHFVQAVVNLGGSTDNGSPLERMELEMRIPKAETKWVLGIFL